MNSLERSFGSWKLWAAAALSAGLLELPFPLAGPLPPWRSVFAWFGLVPLLFAILSAASGSHPRPLRRAFLVGYLSGFLWYMGNCYWVRDTMAKYGDLPAIVPVLLLIGYSLVLGLYFGFFALCVALVRKSTGSVKLALSAAPIFWTALELAAARITSVPWDQLGYSQVDNSIVNQFAPFTGVYGISFLIVAVNALIAGGILIERCPPKPFWQGRKPWGIAGALLMVGFTLGIYVLPQNPAPTATAVLIQPNLDVGANTSWSGPGEWEQHIAEFTRLAEHHCTSGAPGSLGSSTYIAGIPETGASSGEIICPLYPIYPDLVAWPESPAPFDESDTRFQRAIADIARTVHAPVIVGNIGWDFDVPTQQWNYFNSALIEGADGNKVGRYDKVHLVPFGEYIPFQNLLSFAHKLTGRVSKFTRGSGAKVFLLPTSTGQQHRYGVFICYESVFADEIREFPRLGAEVLVNISDDGWYGDTSAPWQHFNMVRMRAIENRRWILRDTNNGVTAVIDPNGRVRQSIPRHQVDALPAQFGFRDDVTFYTEHGDVFAWLCAVLGLGILGWVRRKRVTTA
jgi:apolipoprotein N-acyltransferase